MAFKTDSIKLKNYADDDARDAAIGSPANGDLAVNDGALQIYNGSWGAVAGGGGATNLVGLSDVPSGPSTQHHIAKVNASSQLEFGLLTVANIDPGAIQLSAESFSDSDSILMTAKAIDDQIDDNVLINANTVKHTAWSAALELGSGSTVNNVVFYNTTAQGNTHALTIPPTTDYAPMAQVQIINGSPDDMHITRKSNGNPNFNWQVKSAPSVSQVDIGIGQRAIFLKTAASNWDVVVLSL